MKTIIRQRETTVLKSYLFIFSGCKAIRGVYVKSISLLFGISPIFFSLGSCKCIFFPSKTSSSTLKMVDNVISVAHKSLRLVLYFFICLVKLPKALRLDYFRVHQEGSWFRIEEQQRWELFSPTCSKPMRLRWESV